jgi:SAM-dependent methyltransferase
MQRVPEPELMDDPAQALAYTQADFSASHGRRVALFRDLFPGLELTGLVLDLGCGSGDVLLRFARSFPVASFVGLDGSAPMLALAERALADEPQLRPRVRLIEGTLPQHRLPVEPWQLIMSHSLLHQLHQPLGLWRTIAACGRAGCAVFVADLRRPDTPEQARQRVADDCAREPEILRRDYYNSLCAAFEPDEVRAQLAAVNLGRLCLLPQDPMHLTVHGWL